MCHRFITNKLLTKYQYLVVDAATFHCELEASEKTIASVSSAYLLQPLSCTQVSEVSAAELLSRTEAADSHMKWRERGDWEKQGLGEVW